MKRRTFNEVNKIFVDRNCKLLENEFINMKTKMRYICLKHPEETQESTLDVFIRKKTSCSKCELESFIKNNTKYSIENIKILFEERNYTLLEDSYNGYKHKLKYICNKHHESVQKIALANFIMGNGCRFCGLEKTTESTRLTFDEVKIIFESYNLVLLEDEYKNAKTKMKCYCLKHPDKIQYKTVDSLNSKKSGCKYCGYKKRSGENHPNYNANLTKEDRIKKRYSMEYANWRKSVFKRDGYVCQCCGKRGGILNAHHKDGYHWCKERRYDLDNGITLCEECHIEFHTQYGTAFNTEEQFNEWILKKYQQLSFDDYLNYIAE